MPPPCYMIEPTGNVRRPTRAQLKAIVRKAVVARPTKQPTVEPAPQSARQFSRLPENTARDRERQRKMDAQERELKEKDRQIAALKRRLENHPKEKKMRLSGLGTRMATFAANIRLRK